MKFFSIFLILVAQSVFAQSISVSIPINAIGFPTMTQGDADHDGKIEIYYSNNIIGTSNLPFNDSSILESTYPINVLISEINEDMTYTQTLTNIRGFPWAVGDLTGNGLENLLVQIGDTLFIYEQSNMDSYPTELICWERFNGYNGYFYLRLCDTDQDGKMEILMNLTVMGNYGYVRIYEWENDGLVFKWQSPHVFTNSIGKPIFDPNQNGLINFALLAGFPDQEQYTYVYEHIVNTDNEYQLIQIIDSHPGQSEQLMDEASFDGINDFLVIGSFRNVAKGIHYKWFIYKWVNNQFELEYETPWSAHESSIWTFFTWNGASDIDNDGRDEMMVVNYPELRMVEYENGQWTSDWKYPLNSGNIQPFNDILNYPVFVKGIELNNNYPYNGTLLVQNFSPPYNLEQLDLWVVDEIITNLENGDENGSGFYGDDFKSYPNYPNPFNPITMISFTISKSTWITIKIYNILGQLIETIDKRYYTPGTVKLKWNGQNYSSGVYIYRIEMHGRLYIFTGKMHLLK